MVFQSYALYPHMTVRENMAFGLRNIGMPHDEIDARVASAARIAGNRRICSSASPASSPAASASASPSAAPSSRNRKAFLFDEPLSNLDAALRVRTRVELAQLHQRAASDDDLRHP